MPRRIHEESFKQQGLFTRFIKYRPGKVKDTYPNLIVSAASSNEIAANGKKTNPNLVMREESSKQSATVSVEGPVIECHTIKQWNEQIQKAYQSNKLVVVDFTASWLRSCRLIDPILAEFANKMSNVIFLKVEVEKLKSVADDWGVETMPTFIFLKEGKIVDKIVGAQRDELELKIAKHTTATTGENFPLKKNNSILASDVGRVIQCHTIDQWKEQLYEGQKGKKLMVMAFMRGVSHKHTPMLAEVSKKMTNVVFLKVDVDELKVTIYALNLC